MRHSEIIRNYRNITSGSCMVHSIGGIEIEFLESSKNE